MLTELILPGALDIIPELKGKGREYWALEVCESSPELFGEGRWWNLHLLTSNVIYYHGRRWRQGRQGERERMKVERRGREKAGG